MSPRASLPGAEELFRRTSSERKPVASRQQDSKATNLQVAKPVPPAETPERKAPKHEEKVTFYCTPGDLVALDGARLKLRAEHGVAADRGRIVRAALSYVLEDFDARAEDSILLRRLSDQI
ncbi:MAG TPA: hypothetical protein VHV50_13415 [Actinomycetota bacterium]|nr:hypothetical protein [Actinomycetota bacterium]